MGRRNQPTAGRLTARQQKGLDALLSHSSTAAAARASGVPVSTLFAWQASEPFRTEYERARRQLFEETWDTLQKAARGAVAVLAAVCADPSTSAATRVAAADKILAHAFRAHDVIETERRLARCEEMLTARDGVEML